MVGLYCGTGGVPEPVDVGFVFRKLVCVPTAHCLHERLIFLPGLCELNEAD